MADCCFLVERRSVDAAMTSQVARRHVCRSVQAKEPPIVVAPPRPKRNNEAALPLRRVATEACGRPLNSVRLRRLQ